MSYEEALESNKSIAQFMGAEIRMGYAYPYEYCDFKDENGITNETVRVDNLKYNTSWDWLMPVWIKFRDYGFGIDEETKQKLHTNYVARLAQDIAYGTLEEVYHNLSIAINWLNTQVAV